MSGDYYTLVTALPWLPDLDQCRQLPLSRIALEQRLSMLLEPDLQQLQLIESLYHPVAEQFEQLTDPELVARWRAQLQQVRSEPLQQRLLFQLELRTLLAAMRCRDAGLENPAQFHGIGRWLPRIRQHWFEPGFGLEEFYPQLQPLQRLRAKQNPQLLEQALNRLLWDDLTLCERQNHFSFEAVVCFVLRWGIAERHLQQQGDLALQRFNDNLSVLLTETGFARQLQQGVQ